MSNVVYLTFNDAPGGIFTSQVSDVCRFLQAECNVKVTLISFISIRGFFHNRKRIRSLYPAAIVLPMWPGIDNWKKNESRVRRYVKKLNADTVIARGPFAALLAKNAGAKKVCFDARGAYAAEFWEYDLAGGKLLATEVESIEREALTKCDCAIAVSESLVRYWKSRFGYNGNKHVVIPCTLGYNHRSVISSASQSGSTEKIRIVFSGGNGKWQSLELMSEILMPLFEKQPEVELLMLTAVLPAPFPLKDKYPDRVSQKWVHESQVAELLASSNYGWLVRENTVTNEVASPVKFAEYLAAGLSVIISEGLGDFSRFVEENSCGIVVRENTMDVLLKPEISQRSKNMALAEEYFTKTHYIESYRKCL